MLSVTLSLKVEAEYSSEIFVSFTRECNPTRPQFERRGGFSVKGLILEKYS